MTNPMGARVTVRVWTTDRLSLTVRTGWVISVNDLGGLMVELDDHKIFALDSSQIEIC